jgi:hypothetical protein
MVKLKTILDVRRAKTDGTYTIPFRITKKLNIFHLVYQYFKISGIAN